MKILFRLVILILLAFLCAKVIKYLDGHVIILFHQYRVDLSLTTLILGVLATLLISYFLIRVWINLLRLPAKIKQWFSKDSNNIDQPLNKSF